MCARTGDHVHLILKYFLTEKPDSCGIRIEIGLQWASFPGFLSAKCSFYFPEIQKFFCYFLSFLMHRTAGYSLGLWALAVGLRLRHYALAGQCGTDCCGTF